MTRRRRASPLGLEAAIAVILALVLMALTKTQAAPWQDITEIQQYTDGCYYNYNHYNEGDRILTNEPCLNCTCHNKMLMCYLRVCPFTKPIGHDCIVEKREDQCCPIITCPEVPVDIAPHHPSDIMGTELSVPEKYGCSIGSRFYPEGAQVPSNPNKPCELCYCIRNRTSCLMQECTLHIEGCTPIYNRGSCCPVRYNCDHENDVLELEDHSSTSTSTTTTVRPTPGFILSTTLSPSISMDCTHNGVVYADGSSLRGENPCEHCYCMRGDIVCAVQECEMPMLGGNGKSCQPVLDEPAGECCPTNYICKDDLPTNPQMIDTLPPINTTLRAELDRDASSNNTIKDLHSSVSQEDLQLQAHIDDDDGKKTTVEPGKLTIDDRSKDRNDPGSEGNILTTTHRSSIEDQRKPTVADVLEEEELKTSQTTERLRDPESTTIMSDSQKLGSSETIRDDSYTTISSSKVFDTTQKEPIPESSTLKSNELNQETESTTLITKYSESDGSTIKPSLSEGFSIRPTSTGAVDTDTSVDEHTSIEDEMLRTTFYETTTHKGIDKAHTEVLESEKEDLNEKDVEQSSEKINSPEEATYYPPNVEGTVETSVITTQAAYVEKDIITSKTTSETNAEENVWATTHQSFTERKADAPTTIATTLQTVTETGAHMVTSKTTSQNFVPSEEESLDSMTEASESKESDVQNTDNPLERKGGDKVPHPKPVNEVDSGEIQSATENIRQELTTTFTTSDDEQTATTHSAHKPDSQFVPSEEKKHNEANSEYLNVGSTTTSPEHTTDTDMHDFTTSAADGIPSTTRHSGASTSEHYDGEPVTISDTTRSSEEETLSTESSVSISTEPELIKSTVNYQMTGGYPFELDKDHKRLNEGMIPEIIPGEGDCLVEQQTYPNNSKVPSFDECKASCICRSSIVICQDIECQIPNDISKCIKNPSSSNKCCPEYICEIESVILSQTESNVEKEKETKHQYIPTNTSLPNSEQVYNEKNVPTAAGELVKNEEPEAATEGFSIEIDVPTVSSAEAMSHVKDIAEGTIRPEPETESNQFATEKEEAAIAQTVTSVPVHELLEHSVIHSNSDILSQHPVGTEKTEKTGELETPPQTSVSHSEEYKPQIPLQVDQDLSSSTDKLTLPAETSEDAELATDRSIVTTYAVEQSTSTIKYDEHYSSSPDNTEEHITTVTTINSTNYGSDESQNHSEMTTDSVSHTSSSSSSKDYDNKSPNEENIQFTHSVNTKEHATPLGATTTTQLYEESKATTTRESLYSTEEEDETKTTTVGELENTDLLVSTGATAEDEGDIPKHTTTSSNEEQKLKLEGVKYSGSGLDADRDYSMLSTTGSPTEKSTILMDFTTRRFSESEKGENEPIMTLKSETNALDDILSSTDAATGTRDDQTSGPLSDDDSSHKHPASEQNNEDELVDVSTISPAEKQHHDFSSEYTTHRFSEEDENESYTTHENKLSADDDLLSHTTIATGLGDNTPTAFHEYDESSKHTDAGEDREDSLIGGYATLTPTEKPLDILNYTIKYFTEEDEKTKYESSTNQIIDSDGADDHHTLDKTTQPAISEGDKRTNQEDILGSTIATTEIKEDIKHTTYSINESQESSRHPTSEEDDINEFVDHTIIPTQEPADIHDYTTHRFSDEVKIVNELSMNHEYATNAGDDVLFSTIPVTETENDNSDHTSPHPFSEDKNNVMGYTSVPTLTPDYVLNHTTHSFHEKVEEITENESFKSPEFKANITDGLLSSTISGLDAPSDPFGKDGGPSRHPEDSQEEGMDELIDHTILPTESIDDTRVHENQDHTPVPFSDEDLTEEEDGKNDLLLTTIFPTESPVETHVYTTKDHTPSSGSFSKMGDGITEDDKNERVTGSTMVPEENLHDILDVTTKTFTEEKGQKEDESFTNQGTESGISEEFLSSTITETKMKDIDALSHTSRPFSESDESVKHSLEEGGGVDDHIGDDAISPTEKTVDTLDYTTKQLTEEKEGEEEGDKKKVEESFNRPENDSNPDDEIENYTLPPKTESITQVSIEMANETFDESSPSSSVSVFGDEKQESLEHSSEPENAQTVDEAEPVDENLTPTTSIKTGKPTDEIVDKNYMDESTTSGSVHFESHTTTSFNDVKFEAMDSKTDEPLEKDTVTPEIRDDRIDITKTPYDAKEEEAPLTFYATASTEESKEEEEDTNTKSATTDTILTSSDNGIDHSHTKTISSTEISVTENEPSRIDDSSEYATSPKIDIRTEESVTDRIMTHPVVTSSDSKFKITDFTTPTAAVTDVEVTNDEIDTTALIDSVGTSVENTSVRLPEDSEVTTSIIVKEPHDDNSIPFNTNVFGATEPTATLSPHIVGFEGDSTTTAAEEHKIPLAGDDDKNDESIVETTLSSATEESVENWTQRYTTVPAEKMGIKETNITVISTHPKEDATESSSYETTIASQTENNEDTPYTTVNAIKMETINEQELVEHTIVPLLVDSDRGGVGDDVLNNRTQIIDDKIEVYTTLKPVSNADNINEVEGDEETEEEEKEHDSISATDNAQENSEAYTLGPATDMSKDNEEISTTVKSFTLSTTPSVAEKTKGSTEDSLINTFETSTKFEKTQESAQSLDESIAHLVNDSSNYTPIFGVDGKIKDISKSDSSSPSAVSVDVNNLQESEILEELNPETTTYSTSIPDNKFGLDNSTHSSEEKDISYTTAPDLLGSSGISMTLNDTQESLPTENILEGANLYTSSPFPVHEKENIAPDIVNKSTIEDVEKDTSYEQTSTAQYIPSEIMKGEVSTSTLTPNINEVGPSSAEIESKTQTTGFYEDIRTSTSLPSVKAGESVEHEGEKYTTIKESSNFVTQEPLDVIMKNTTSLSNLGSNEQELLHTSDLDTLQITTASSINEMTNHSSVEKFVSQTESENNTKTKIDNVPGGEEEVNNITSTESDENTKFQSSENKTNHVDELHSTLLPHMTLSNVNGENSVYKTSSNPEQITSKPERFPINTNDFLELTTKSSASGGLPYVDNAKEDHTNVTDFDGAKVTYPEEGVDGLQPLNNSSPSTITYSTSFVDYTKLSTTTASTTQTSEPYTTPTPATSQYPHQPPPPPIYGGHPPQYPTYPEDEYTDEDEAEVFGPGTCRYGGKLFVSAQQIPRDDPCDFCFCFRSDIICLQQSCPPPISGCHEEPISGFCCPRYECPVSMATVLNITTSTTTTSTTLPPHFPYHAYEGAAQRNGCQIEGKSYRVGQKIDSASGPCMHCTCGGDGQMKCDPKTCSPEPMLRQMIAVVASRRR